MRKGGHNLGCLGMVDGMQLAEHSGEREPEISRVLMEWRASSMEEPVR